MIKLDYVKPSPSAIWKIPGRILLFSSSSDFFSVKKYFESFFDPVMPNVSYFIHTFWDVYVIFFTP